MAAWAELASGATGVWRAEFGMDVPVEPGHSCEQNGRAPGIVGREPAVRNLSVAGMPRIEMAPVPTSLGKCRQRLGCETRSHMFSTHPRLSGKPPSSYCGGKLADL